MKRIISIGLICLIMLTGCSTANETLSFGLEKIENASEPSPQLSIGGKTLARQDLKVEVDVYVGAVKGFETSWDNDVLKLETNPGSFHVTRVILDMYGKTIQKDNIHLLENFPSYEMYPLDYEHIEGTTDGVIPEYEYFFRDEFDLSDLSINEGSIMYSFVYIEDDTNIEDNEFHLYGVSNGGFSFIKENNEVVFKK